MASCEVIVIGEDAGGVVKGNGKDAGTNGDVLGASGREIKGGAWTPAAVAVGAHLHR